MNLDGYGAITSVLVARDGDMLAEAYVEGDADALRNTRSCTKTVAGMLLGIAIARGAVRGADATLGELLDERAHLYPDPRKEQITLEQLLTKAARRAGGAAPLGSRSG